MEELKPILKAIGNFSDADKMILISWLLGRSSLLVEENIITDSVTKETFVV